MKSQTEENYETKMGFPRYFLNAHAYVHFETNYFNLTDVSAKRK
jgi:hypothetical protein